MASNYSDLRGKTALITGCNRGIGKDILTKFASQGVNIVACVRTASNEFSAYLNTLCENYDINIEIVFVDLANPNVVVIENVPQIRRVLLLLCGRFFRRKYR